VVIQPGSPTVCVQRLVEVGCKHDRERVLIHRLQMAERTAADWDLTALPGNATIRSVQVKSTSVVHII